MTAQQQRASLLQRFAGSSDLSVVQEQALSTLSKLFEGVDTPSDPKRGGYSTTVGALESWAASEAPGALRKCRAGGPDRPSEELRDSLEAQDALLREAESWESIVASACEEQAKVRERTRELHDMAQELSSQHSRLKGVVAAVEGKLWYYEQLFPLTQWVGSFEMPVGSGGHSAPATSLSSASGASGVSASLRDLDLCVEFMAGHPGFVSATEYLTKYRQLRSRALAALVARVTEGIKSTAQTALTHLQLQGATAQSAGTRPPVLTAETLESAPSSLHFRVLAARLRADIVELEKRARIAEHAGMLIECHECYLQQRKALLMAQVGASLSSLVTQDLTASFFASDDLASRLVALLSVCLSDVLRPQILRASSIDTLCSVASLLHRDGATSAFDPQPLPAGSGVVTVSGRDMQPLFDALDFLLKDLQERVAYLSQKSIQQDVVNFVPDDSDLAYPARLSAGSRRAERTQDTDGDERDVQKEIESIYATWYPTLQRTLMLLSKLYLTVDMRVFEGLAFDAVDACIASLLRAQTLIEAKSSLDGYLFIIKHLLTLREQIAPFEASFAVTTVSLDFSHTRSEFRRLFSGEWSSLFSLETITPKIFTDKLDSRKRLDSQLNVSVAAFIVSNTKLLTRPLMSLLLQISSFERVKQQQGIAQAGASSTVAATSSPLAAPAPPPPQTLAQLPWAAADKFTGVAKEVMTFLAQQLPTITSKLVLYLGPITAKALLSPLRHNVLDSWEELLAAFHKVHGEHAVATLPPSAEFAEFFDHSTAPQLLSKEDPSPAARGTTE